MCFTESKSCFFLFSLFVVFFFILFYVSTMFSCIQWSFWHSRRRHRWKVQTGRLVQVWRSWWREVTLHQQAASKQLKRSRGRNLCSLEWGSLRCHRASLRRHQLQARGWNACARNRQYHWKPSVNSVRIIYYALFWCFHPTQRCTARP